MSEPATVNHRENAEVYTDPVICKQKIAELLKEIHLPSGLLPLEDLVEVGRNLQTGFVWIKQKKATEHKFNKVKKLVSYDTELTMFVEDRRMKKLTGLKSKEVFAFFTISDVSITDPEGKKINFTTSTGICVSFPASAFDKEEEEEEGKGKK